MKQSKKRPTTLENPVSDAYPLADTDLARDNIENDLPEADKNQL